MISFIADHRGTIVHGLSKVPIPWLYRYEIQKEQ